MVPIFGTLHAEAQVVLLLGPVPIFGKGVDATHGTSRLIREQAHSTAITSALTGLTAEGLVAVL